MMIKLDYFDRALPLHLFHPILLSAVCVYPKIDLRLMDKKQVPAHGYSKNAVETGITFPAVGQVSIRISSATPYDWTTMR